MTYSSPKLVFSKCTSHFLDCTIHTPRGYRGVTQLFALACVSVPKLFSTFKLMQPSKRSRIGKGRKTPKRNHIICTSGRFSPVPIANEFALPLLILSGSRSFGMFCHETYPSCSYTWIPYSLSESQHR